MQFQTQECSSIVFSLYNAFPKEYALTRLIILCLFCLSFLVTRILWFPYLVYDWWFNYNLKMLIPWWGHTCLLIYYFMINYWMYNICKKTYKMIKLYQGVQVRDDFGGKFEWMILLYSQTTLFVLFFVCFFCVSLFYDKLALVCGCVVCVCVCVFCLQPIFFPQNMTCFKWKSSKNTQLKTKSFFYVCLFEFLFCFVFEMSVIFVHCVFIFFCRVVAWFWLAIIRVLCFVFFCVLCFVGVWIANLRNYSLTCLQTYLDIFVLTVKWSKKKIKKNVFLTHFIYIFLSLCYLFYCDMFIFTFWAFCLKMPLITAIYLFMFFFYLFYLILRIYCWHLIRVVCCIRLLIQFENKHFKL